MKKKQTALDWYIEQEQILGDKLVNDTLDLDQFNNEVAKLKTQAKQMEKEQIENAWDKICSYGVVSQTWRVETTNGEQYYNETYGGNNDN
jgi:hypothetical protein